MVCDKKYDELLTRGKDFVCSSIAPMVIVLYCDLSVVELPYLSMIDAFIILMQHFGFFNIYVLSSMADKMYVI